MALTTIEIPPRSRLHYLEPAGVGTPYIESLSSYFRRLAQSHHVSTANLYKREVASLLQKIRTDHKRGPHPYSRHIQISIGVINGSFRVTAAWVQVLEALTKRSDLRLLTALPIGNAVSPRCMMKGAMAWCSSCYDEWLGSSRTVYTPLLWTFNAVEVCPRHKQPLEQICPHCKRSQTLLSSMTRPGYCSRCYGNLCSNSENKRLIFNAESRWKQN